MRKNNNRCEFSWKVGAVAATVRDTGLVIERIVRINMWPNPFP